MLRTGRLVRCCCEIQTRKCPSPKFYFIGKIHGKKDLRRISSTSYMRTQVDGKNCDRQQTPTDTEKQGRLLGDPFSVVHRELHDFASEIKKELSSSVHLLRECSHYYFDGHGKFFRPACVLLIARACNFHQGKESATTKDQRKIALISEMIHTATLLHDDVIDAATLRRQKASVNVKWSEKQAILAGDYIIAQASIALARIGNPSVVQMLSQVLEDLVRGELMQLITQNDPDQRFNHYLTKTFKKTASLVAYCCKAVALLGGCNEDIQNECFNFGKNVGLSFQLVDDALDFTATSANIGKSAGADLQLGLATAPVLFAVDKFPELNTLIVRRFKEPGDVIRAAKLVKEGDGVRQTYILAMKYADAAVENLNLLRPSLERDSLTALVDFVVRRTR